MYVSVRILSYVFFHSFSKELEDTIVFMINKKDPLIMNTFARLVYLCKISKSVFAVSLKI